MERDEPKGQTPEEAARASRANPQAKNTALLIVFSAFAVFMFGFAYANASLFGMLCQKLGVSQSPNQARVATSPNGRSIKIIFSGTVADSMPIYFIPSERSKEVQLGKPAMLDYTFINLSGKKVFFRPVHTIFPPEAATKLNLSKCFCFNDQCLMPNQRMTLPVVFTIGSDLSEDVQQAAFSYTLFQISEDRFDPQRNSKATLNP